MKVEIYLSDKGLCKSSESEKIEFNEIVSMAMSGTLLKMIFHYDKLVIYSKSFNSLPAPFLAICICRMICRGHAEWQDERGEVRKIGLCLILRLFIGFVKEHMTYKSTIKKIDGEVDSLLKKEKDDPVLCIDKRPLFLRLDLTFGIMAGGSVGHIAGVVNNLGKYSGSPILVSSDPIPTVKDFIEFVCLNEDVPYRNVSRISAFMFNLVNYPILEELVEHNDISFIYQRSGLDVYSGVKLALSYNLPYVLEYNGSEVWCDIHWGGNNLRYIELAEKIETLTFKHADLITCVSEPLRQELIGRGVEKDKIIVTPNGVDPERYYPGIDKQTVRKKYNIGHDQVVIGFIGTFGAWHGTEILTEAYAELRKDYQNIHLLMIGDGIKMGEVKQIIQANHLEEYVTLTGIVPQKEGALYLAACDILVSPTLKNPDGTPFFGSPTKIFEYMAMGKGIVASDIDQMAEVLKNNETALLVEPNSVQAVKEAIGKLVENNELRTLLGQNARKEVCSKYTWEMHTGRIVAALKCRMKGEKQNNVV